MDREEIINRIMDILNFHLNNTAHMGQEPYRGDIFSVFKEAYKNNLCNKDNPDQLTGDVLTSLANARLSEQVDKPEYDQTLERFTTMWNEWRYAFDNY